MPVNGRKRVLTSLLKAAKHGSGSLTVSERELHEFFTMWMWTRERETATRLTLVNDGRTLRMRSSRKWLMNWGKCRKQPWMMYQEQWQNVMHAEMLTPLGAWLLS